MLNPQTRNEVMIEILRRDCKKTADRIKNKSSARAAEEQIFFENTCRWDVTVCIWSGDLFQHGTEVAALILL